MTTVVDEKDILVERLELGPWGTNCYVVVCRNTSHSLVIDAPADVPKIMNALKDTVPRYILLTHDHHDHTGVLDGLRKRTGAPLAAHPASTANVSPPPERLLKDGDVLSLGNLKIDVIDTPGHTKGSMCYKIRKYLFAGDTIFPGGPGRTDSPLDFKMIIASISGKILALPDETIIFPGHGDSTTVEKAKKEYEIFGARRHPDDLSGDVLWLSH
jgi:hydroxyacylglutathione hydrolase